MNTLLAVDTHSLIYRAVHANPREAPQILHGLLKSVIGSTHPTHVIAASDGPREELARRRLFPQYKSGRTELDQEKQTALRACLAYISATGLTTVQIPGWEADDVIATVVDICAGPRCECIIATSDKDLGQLVTSSVSLFDGKRFIGVDDVLERWGVLPFQVPEVQALCGDPSDDIPGVPGVGPKTAAKWILEYGSAESVWKNRASLTAAKQKAMEGYDWKLHIDLVTLRRDLDICVSAPELRWSGLDMPAIEELLGGWHLRPASVGAG